ncbi:elongation factor 4 [Candidatus Wolfebacteria bacterium]|nr:elongation factor 4 [Candidatus Wolfebacteria bacterium]
MIENIRNFVIIAHIDHGKSTLADRFLELTKTVEIRQMKPQFLDRLESERERGITIKMAPVRMIYRPQIKNAEFRIQNENNESNEEKNSKFLIYNSELSSSEYILNLIDTPGHSDFSYEVSRALAAVEGAILLVDATQGIQAQTLVNFRAAQKSGLKIIGAINKVDLIDDLERLEKSIKELADLIGCRPEEIHKISGKTGEGVEKLLEAIVRVIPSPTTQERAKALIFDSLYDEHKGIIAFVRVFGGKYKAGDETKLVVADEKLKIKEVGYFSPQLKPAAELFEGEIGYIATGVKDTDKLRIGDTIGDEALVGYKEPKAVVFVSVYPDDPSQYEDLKVAFQKLKLNDSSLIFSPDMNEMLGRGFKCGFLGQLHFEITAERLEKEFKIETVSTFPSVAYKIKQGNDYKIIENPDDLPVDCPEVSEPTIKIEIITPIKHLGGVLQLKEIFRMEKIETSNLEDKILINAAMPLSSLIADFDDKLKSVSEGMASFSYELGDYRPAKMEKAEILVAGEPVPGLTRLIYKDEIETESRRLLEKLKEILPRQQFTQALQAKAGNKIVARENIPALKKDVTGYLYGGDRTRKMKLWKKQKEGKKKLKAAGKVRMSADIFKELLKR